MAQSFVVDFAHVTLKNIEQVGGKNASLGEMISTLSDAGITVPHGFAVTADAYWYFVSENKLTEPITSLIAQLGEKDIDIRQLHTIGKQIRQLFYDARTPNEILDAIAHSYTELSQRYDVELCDVAVRSSATAEDLPTASFAGQQETFLNVRGVDELCDAYKKCLASLFTDRAISYRHEKGFDHMAVALSVGVQKMVRADKASSGVAFSLDTESGFRDVVLINSSFGLGESIVQGLVIPDEFMVHKTTLNKGFLPLIKKTLGVKEVTLVYGDDDASVKQRTLDTKHQRLFSLTDDEVFSLARMIITIEKHYVRAYDRPMAIDVEWAKDGNDGRLYILQARPETVHSPRENNGNVMRMYELTHKEELKILASGLSIGQHIAHGVVRVVKDASNIHLVNEGDIIVTEMTDPDWVPAMRRASAIITERGGRTCHAAIVSRELGIPALVGVNDAMSVLKNGQVVTIDCSRGMQGIVYDGEVPFKVNEVELDVLPSLSTQVMINLADPSRAFTHSFLPVDGVGLARLEFIITNAIQIHPSALVYPEHVVDKEVNARISELTRGYKDGTSFFIETLAHHVGMIAAAFYPRPVLVRLTDFKTNEYRNLIGGSYFEVEEENPMLGFRGASRYYHESYKKSFALECAALKRVRAVMGFDNVAVMVPFVRTVKEAQKVVKLLTENELTRGVNGLELVMMCEIPSNVLLIDEFSNYFDGFSIGSNDLTQLTLGVDRDSELLSPLFDERDKAVKKMMAQTIKGAHKQGKYVGICGQAPSDYPEIATFLLEQSIDSISLNSDSIIPFMLRQK